MPLPPIPRPRFPDWWRAAWKALQLDGSNYPGGGGGGGGKDYRRCTTDNLASANNFIRAGYRLYQPQHPWAWPNTLYWRKSIR
jgi:hypothetical protein